jgi:hypothetical protein
VTLDRQLLDAFAVADRRRLFRARLILGWMISIVVGLFALMAVYAGRIALGEPKGTRAIVARDRAQIPTIDPCQGCVWYWFFDDPNDPGRCLAACRGREPCAIPTAYAVEPPACDAKCCEGKKGKAN